MAVAGFVGGAALGAAFGGVFAVLHDTVKNVGSKVLMFESELKSLKSNLDLLAPVVDEISRLNRELGSPEVETKRLIEDMEKAEKLIHIISEKKGWTSNFQVYHSKQLTELDKAIVKFCQVHMPAQIRRDTLQIIRDTSQISHNLEDTSQTLQMVLEEFKALREENKLKKEKAQILITEEGQCGNTTSLEIHGHDVLIKGFASISLMNSLSTRKIQSSSLFSYSTPRRRYDVILSFIGNNTRMNFADHLYVALEQKGIVTFKGEDTHCRGSNPRKVIEESMFAIVLLSGRLGSWPWLDELHEIVSCKRETGLRILPIFYDVNPSVVQKMLFGRLFGQIKIMPLSKKKKKDNAFWKTLGTPKSLGTKRQKPFKDNNGPVERFGKVLLRNDKPLTDNNERVETWKPLTEFNERVETWNAALRDMTNLRAWNLTYQPRSNIIQSVVEEISHTKSYTF